MGNCGGDTGPGDYVCEDPSKLVVVGQRVRLHTPPRDVTAISTDASETCSFLVDKKEIEEMAANKTDSDDSLTSDQEAASVGEISTPPPLNSKKSGSRRPTLSPVVEECDVREYLQNWSVGIEDDQDNDVDCGAGDATNMVDIALGDSENDYATELSKALSSAALDAALEELDYESKLLEEETNRSRDKRDSVMTMSLKTADKDDLEDSADDIVIILPEARELTYHNVPATSGIEVACQEAEIGRNQLEAQADFLENSLNCLEVTLDRMSLNEAVMPDGSVVFLKDQLRKSRTGHLLRAWEKAKGIFKEYTSIETPDGSGEKSMMDKPLAQIQKEIYQDQIRNFSGANEDMRTAVTHATLQEQALRGQTRQLEQTFAGLQHNTSNLTQELVELQTRQQQLQQALTDERRAKEAAERDSERLFRKSSSDILQQDESSTYEEQTEGGRQPRWMRHNSGSTSSLEVPYTSQRSAPRGSSHTSRWWDPPGRRRDFPQPPPPRRRGNRYPFSRRTPYAQRPWRGGYHGNWRWHGHFRGPPRPLWGRSCPPPHSHPFPKHPPPPIQFSQPFKKETEVMLRQYFHEMGRVEDLLRERGFAKGPAAVHPGRGHFDPRPPRFQAYPERRHGWQAPYSTGRMGSRSVPAMGLQPYRDRSRRTTGSWFESSKSQTTQAGNGQMSVLVPATSSTEAPQAAASA
ncbi:uncharacterized protein [Diadema setosum]|uniref:uncharacterized protein n=1 Tax=Diadema setosum TaxID=31175 RepID=UPI003B3AAFF9